MFHSQERTEGASMRMSAELDNIDLACREAKRLIEERNLGQGGFPALLVLREALSNAVIHGSGKDATNVEVGGEDVAATPDTAGIDATVDPGPQVDANEDTGQCPGCEIEGQCVPAGSVDAVNPCLVCDPTASTHDWSSDDGAVCDDGVFCNGDDACKDGACTLHTANACDDGWECDEELGDCCWPQETQGCGVDGADVY